MCRTRITVRRESTLALSFAPAASRRTRLPGFRWLDQSLAVVDKPFDQLGIHGRISFIAAWGLAMLSDRFRYSERLIEAKVDVEIGIPSDSRAGQEDAHLARRRKGHQDSVVVADVDRTDRFDPFT